MHPGSMRLQKRAGVDATRQQVHFDIRTVRTTRFRDDGMSGPRQFALTAEKTVGVDAWL